jgi:nicotinamidase-related amidase
MPTPCDDRRVTRALLVVDIQRDYFPGGAYPLHEPEGAAAAARRVLDGFRERGEAVVHLRHVWDAPDATFMRPGTDGVEIHPDVAPAAGEPVLTKEHPNGFNGTALEHELRSRGVDSLVVAGMMTSMCVDATVRAAVDLGFATTVVHDACAAPDLAFGETTVPAPAVHAAFMAALADGYAAVVAADELD